MRAFVVSKFNEGFSPGKTMKLLMAAGVYDDHAHIEALVWWEWDHWLYKVRIILWIQQPYLLDLFWSTSGLC
jgi:hypothetical protein